MRASPVFVALMASSFLQCTCALNAPSGLAVQGECTATSCVVQWTASTSPEVAEHAIVDHLDQTICVAGPSATSCDIATSSMRSFLNCAPYSMTVEARGANESAASDPARIVFQAPIQMSAPTITNIIPTTIVQIQFSFNTTARWVSYFNLTLNGAEHDQLTLEWPRDEGKTEFEFLVSGLNERERYTAQIRGFSCGQASILSQSESFVTSRRIDVSDNVNSVTKYLEIHWTITNLESSFNDFDLFFAVFNQLENAGFPANDVSPVRFDTLSTKGSTSDLMVVTQFRVRSTLEEQVEIALQDMVGTNPCASDLLEDLKLLSTVWEGGVCVNMTGIPSSSFEDATAPRRGGDSKEASTDWDTVGIIIGACIGGIILLGFIVILAAQVRRNCAEDLQERKGANLGVELRAASMY